MKCLVLCVILTILQVYSHPPNEGHRRDDVLVAGPCGHQDRPEDRPPEFPRIFHHNPVIQYKEHQEREKYKKEVNRDLRVNTEESSISSTNIVSTTIGSSITANDSNPFNFQNLVNVKNNPCAENQQRDLNGVCQDEE